MISTLDLPKAVHRVAVATAPTALVTELKPVQPGLSRVDIGQMPEPSALRLHPYRLEMRRHALYWRSVRYDRTKAEESAHALITAITYNRWHYNMVVRRAGA